MAVPVHPFNTVGKQGETCWYSDPGQILAPFLANHKLPKMHATCGDGRAVHYTVNKGIGKEPIVKPNGYPIQIVQLEYIIDKLNMMHGGYSYVYTTNCLGCNQRDNQHGARCTGML
jgi:hypothetical protein